MQLKSDDNDINSSGGQGNNTYGGPANNNYGGPANNSYGGPANSNYGDPVNNNYGEPVNTNYREPAGLNMDYDIPSPVSYAKSVVQNTTGMTKVIIFIMVALVIGVVIFVGLDKYKKLYGKAEYIPGTYNDQEFKNEFFEIKISLGSNYEAKKYAYDAEAEKKTLESGQLVTELQAENQKDIAVIAFSVQQTPYNVAESSTKFDKMLDTLKEEFKREMESQGISVSSIERDTITLAGETCEGFRITGTMAGVPQSLSLVQYYTFKANYMGVYSASATSESKAKEALTSSISKLGN